MSSHKLALSSDLSLPTDAVTQRFGFIGRIGSGKSYASTKLAELMLEIGAQVIAIDPVGVWYGLRVDGKGKGFDIPVFGGLRGDIPLEPTAGALIADLVVDRTLSCVIDVSQFATDADKARFAAAFAERFFFRKKAKPSAVHLFLEECQEFVPQNPGRGEEMMLHHFTRMAKLGRNFGIGLSLITQRPQEVNKKVLNLTECLLAFQMTGTHERKAIREWVASKGADEDILDILPTLPVGRAHLYSPQWLGLSRQIKAFEKRSADVSSTPQVGASIAQAKPLTPVDVEALRGKMAETIERAKADDPKELRKEIAALKKQLASAPVKSIEKPVVDERAIARAVASAVAAERTKLAKIAKRIESQHNTIGRALEEIAVASKVTRDLMLDMNDHSAEDSRAGARVRVERNDATGVTTGWKPPRQAQRPAVEPNADASIGGTPQRILNALLFLETVGTSPASRQAIAGLVGVSWDTGTFRTYLSQLRALGLINDGTSGSVSLTDEGRSRANDDGLPTTRKELHHAWLSKLGGRPRMLAELLATYPQALDRESLGEACGIDASTGTFRTYLSQLRSLGLITEEGKHAVRAADALFPEGLR